MAPLPKRKISKARQGKRRKNIKLKATNLVPCPNCSEPKLPHRVCPNCGFYNNKQVIKPKPPKKRQHVTR